MQTKDLVKGRLVCTVAKFSCFISYQSCLRQHGPASHSDQPGFCGTWSRAMVRIIVKFCGFIGDETHV